MKDKEKQIDCDTCLYKEMCFYQEEITDCNEWAKEFQCKDYKPKLPKDSVVLSKAKYEMLTACSSYEGVMGKLKDEYVRGSKETATEIIAHLKNRQLVGEYELNKLAEKYGVELGE